MAKRALPLGKVSTLIEPGPVVLLSTAHRGERDVMTQSWHVMLEFEPPLIGCVISDRNRSFALLKASRECVINIPGVELGEAVARCGNRSGRQLDKFAACRLTPRPAREVGAPLIDECFANLECRVVDTRLVPSYGFFVLQVLRAWVDPAVKDPRTLHHRGRGRFMVAGETIRLRSRAR